jgi:hypothetical protein
MSGDAMPVSIETFVCDQPRRIRSSRSFDVDSMRESLYPPAVQNSHRELDKLTLPKEWGLTWRRSAGSRVVLAGDPAAPLPADDGEWAWCEGFLWLDQGDRYEPLPHGPEILDAALRVQPDSGESLLAFVRAWGPLGTLGDSSVWASRRTFRELQRHFAWLQALHRHEWRSPRVPQLWEDQGALLEALRAVVPPPEHPRLEVRSDPRYPDVVREAILTDLRCARRTYADPYVAAFVKGHLYAAQARAGRPLDREAQHWRAFGWAIGEHLRDVNPAVGWDAGHPTAAWEVPRLVDLLWVQLWSLATSGAALRQCRYCRRWFALDYRGKLYCSRKCTNRASAAASYKARKAREKQRTPRRKR